MGSSIGARNALKSILNTSVLDPYPSTRPGNNPLHFYDKSDGLNLSRGDSFPKGFVTINPQETEKQGIGSSGHAIKSTEVNVWYFVKEKISYDDGSTIHKNEDYVTYMIDQIKDTLLSNVKISNEYHIKSLGISTGPGESHEGSFKVYFDVIPVIIYWDDTYGA